LIVDRAAEAYIERIERRRSRSIDPLIGGVGPDAAPRPDAPFMCALAVNKEDHALPDREEGAIDVVREKARLNAPGIKQQRERVQVGRPEPIGKQRAFNLRAVGKTQFDSVDARSAGSGRKHYRNTQVAFRQDQARRIDRDNCR